MLPEIAGTAIPNPMWGGFSFERVLDYYDGPRLLLQRSLAGQLFLAWWSDSDASADRWIYLPLSEQRLASILSGETPALEGLKNPEDGYIFVVDMDVDTDSIDRTVMTTVAALPDDTLPRPEVRLNIPMPEEVGAYGLVKANLS